MPDWWTRLDPKWQRLLVVASVVIVLIAVIYPFVSQDPVQRRRGARDETIKQILTDKDVRSLGIDGMVAELRTLAQRMDGLNKDIQQLQTGKSTSMEENLRRIQAEVEGRLNELRELKEDVRRLASRAETAAAPPAEAKEPRERLPRDRDGAQPAEGEPPAATLPLPRATLSPERQPPPKPGTVDRSTLAPGTLFQPLGLAGAGPNKIGELPPAAPSPGLLPAAAKAPASPPEIRVLRQTAAPREGEQPPARPPKAIREKVDRQAPAPRKRKTVSYRSASSAAPC